MVPDLPRNALRRVPIDHCLRAEEIAAMLLPQDSGRLRSLGAAAATDWQIEVQMACRVFLDHEFQLLELLLRTGAPLRLRRPAEVAFSAVLRELLARRRVLLGYGTRSLSALLLRRRLRGACVRVPRPGAGVPSPPPSPVVRRRSHMPGRIHKSRRIHRGHSSNHRIRWEYCHPGNIRYRSARPCFQHETTPPAADRQRQDLLPDNANRGACPSRGSRISQLYSAGLTYHYLTQDGRQPEGP